MFDRETKHHAKPILISRARAMRKDSAPAEQRLWACLRSGQLDGFKFRRQQPLGEFIADFFCPRCRIVIELDGESHLGQEEYDTARKAWLLREGITVVRYSNIDIFDNLDAVLEDILKRCREAKPAAGSKQYPSPRPSPARGEGELQ